ncbi:MAG: hypothetical protein PHX51_08405 [Clostridia bacterium]|nr:hypothetical protein [Clostridia bacterium]
MPYSIATMASEIDENLGKPDQKTELMVTTAQRICTESLSEFNNKVGVWKLRTFAHTANQQVYDMATIFPLPIKPRLIRYLYNGDTIVERTVAGVTTKYLVMNDKLKTLIPLGADIDVIMAKANFTNMEKYDFEFVEPSTLYLLPPPTVDCVITTMLQEEYDVADLPEDYYKIVRDYAQGQCQEIVANARGRLNSVARTSEIARYTNREKYMYDRADIKLDKFNTACNEIIIGRMRLACAR